MNIIMKSALAFLLLGSMISTNATIARLKALGMAETDNEGSYFIKDNRNIFLNVANIHDYKDSVILEWGGNGNTFGSTSLTTDTDASPKAKGGFIKSHGDYVYGVYLGNESNTSALLRGVATGAYASDRAARTGGAADTMLDGADNQVDLFFGGTTAAGDWAVNFVWTADNEQANRARDIAHAIRFGFKTQKWDAFLNLSTRNKAKQVDTIAAAGGDVFHQFDGKLGVHVGGSYELCPEGRVYGFFKKFDWEQTDSVGVTSGLANLGTLVANGRGQVGTIDGGFSTYALGYGHQVKSGEGTLFASLEFRSKSISADYTAKAEAKNVIAPLMVGYEYNATNWLTFRGSVTQNLYGYRKNNKYTSLGVTGRSAAVQEFGADTNGEKVSISNTTNISTGASLNFGKVSIDGFVGTTSGTRNATTGAENGVFTTDNLLTRVGMTYSF